MMSHYFQLGVQRGGTPMAEGVVLGHRMLSRVPKARRILIVITDGDPDCPTETRVAIDTAVRNGVEVYGVGIKSNGGEGIFPNWLTVDDLAALPTTLLELLRSRVPRAA